MEGFRAALGYLHQCCVTDRQARVDTSISIVEVVHVFNVHGVLGTAGGKICLPQLRKIASKV